MEIAKLKAFRILWESKTGSTPFIFTNTTLQNKEENSPYNNILRTTTECMSAIFGGANAIMVNSYNQSFETPTKFSERIARNQQTILKKENYFDKVIDPTKGSYYVDYLVNELLADLNIKPSDNTKIEKQKNTYGMVSR